MIENFIKNYEYYKNVNLKKYNTYRLECYADYLIFPKDINELVELLDYLRQNRINYIILGGGSNVILAKPCFDVVVKLDKLNNITINDNIVVAEAGVPLIKLANECMKNNLDGLAFAGGIPGMVGASTSMNAGAYNEDMSMVVKEVKVIDPDLKIITLNKEELEYAYRDSFLKRNKDYVCIETTFEMKYKDKDKIKRILTPLDQDILYAIFIDLIRKDKKKERNLSKIEERNYMLSALNKYLDKYANIDNDIHTSKYDFSKIEKQIIDYLYKLDKNGHYNALISLIPQYCKTTDAVDFYDKLKIIKRLIIRRITGIDNVMLLDDDIKVLNEYLFNKMSKSQKDAVINDVIYYQDSNYQIISGNELKKSLKLKPNSKK